MVLYQFAYKWKQFLLKLGIFSNFTGERYNAYMPQVSPLKLANTILSKYGGDGGIEHMKLQKLVYYAYGWWLSFKNEALLTERPQVWRYGPVFKSLYWVFSRYGSQTIKVPERSSPFEDRAELVTDPEILKMIDWVWNKYGSLSGLTLSEKTHEKGTPWRDLAEKHNFKVPLDFEIPDDVMKAHFDREKASLQ